MRFLKLWVASAVIALYGCTPPTPPSSSSSSPSSSSIQAPQTFEEAKRIARDIYDTKGERVTFYCGCNYTDNDVDPESCGFKPRKNEKRADRIEWEHVVPAHALGGQRSCWKEGGRDLCGKEDKNFARAEADLHNLVPAIGEVNGDRSNFPLTVVDVRPEIENQYGQCDMVVDFQYRKAMPPARVRGAVARIYLYMNDKYGLNLSTQDRRIYAEWNSKYPPTQKEKKRNQDVACKMGWGNPYVGEVDMSKCSTASR